MSFGHISSSMIFLKENLTSHLLWSARQMVLLKSQSLFYLKKKKKKIMSGMLSWRKRERTHF